MKFETTLQTLLTAASVAARFSEKKSNLPVLGCVLITAEGSRLILRATNLECGVEVVISAKVATDGIVAVTASVLAGFLGNTRGKSVSVNLVGEVLKITTESSSASIKTLPYEDFPLLPRVPAEHSFTIKSIDFVKAIKNQYFLL